MSITVGKIQCKADGTILCHDDGAIMADCCCGSVNDCNNCDPPIPDTLSVSATWEIDDGDDEELSGDVFWDSNSDCHWYEPLPDCTAENDGETIKVLEVYWLNTQWELQATEYECSDGSWGYVIDRLAVGPTDQCSPEGHYSDDFNEGLTGDVSS